MLVQRPAGTRRPSNLNLRRGPSTNRSYSINTEALVLDGGPGLWVCRAVGVPGLWACRGCGRAGAVGVPGHTRVCHGCGRSRSRAVPDVSEDCPGSEPWKNRTWPRGGEAQATRKRKQCNGIPR